MQKCWCKKNGVNKIGVKNTCTKLVYRKQKYWCEKKLVLIFFLQQSGGQKMLADQ